MGLVPEERSFPRGGIQVQQTERDKSISKIQRRAKDANAPLFGSKSKPKPQPPSSSKSVKRDGFKKDKAPYFRIKRYSGQLTHKTITEGMLILGSVYRIEDLRLLVSLPGHVTGILPLTNVSEEYTTSVQSAMVTGRRDVPRLADMFKVGQHVATRVVKREFRDHCYHVTLSTVPERVYADFGHGDVVKGSVMAAAVKSVEEKGYIMNLGVKSTRAFLNKEKSKAYENTWNDGNPLGVGQVVRCLTTKSTTSDKFTTVELTADPSAVSKASTDVTGATLATLTPGMLFSLTVSRIFPTGIQVRLSDNVVGYVHQDHFSKPFKTPDNHEVNTFTQGRVLYILESGAVHFTLKPGILEARPPQSPFSSVALGATFEEAVVMSVTEAGLVVQLDGAFKAFVPVKRSRKRKGTTEKEEEEEYEVAPEQRMTMDYPIGSKVKCRVVDYNYLEQYYLCTMDEDLQNERIVHVDQLEVGMVVSCFVKSVTPTGVVLKTGKKSSVTGFVPKVHVSDVPLSHHEKKCRVGQSCKARVLTKDPGGKVVFTMKPALVKSAADILTSASEAVVGHKYLGTVVMTKSTGVLVVFYNNVTGWVPLRLLNVGWQEDPAQRFYLGRVVNCKVDSVDVEDDKKLLLSLKTDVNKEDQDLQSEEEDEETEDIPSPSKKKKKRNKKKKSQVALEKTISQLQKTASKERKNGVVDKSEIKAKKRKRNSSINACSKKAKK